MGEVQQEVHTGDFQEGEGAHAVRGIHHAIGDAADVVDTVDQDMNFAPGEVQVAVHKNEEGEKEGHSEVLQKRETQILPESQEEGYSREEAQGQHRTRKEAVREVHHSRLEEGHNLAHILEDRDHEWVLQSKRLDLEN